MPVCEPSRTETCLAAPPRALLSNRQRAGFVVLLSAALLVRVPGRTKLPAVGSAWHSSPAGMGEMGRRCTTLSLEIWPQQLTRNLDVDASTHRTVPYRTAPHRTDEQATAAASETYYATVYSLAGSAISVAYGQPHPSLWAGCMLRLTGGRTSRTTCAWSLDACIGLGLLYLQYHILPYGVPKELLQ